ncbi:hypothetical protein BGZ89_008607 [Linnemannia elongata]|nr:hypothetical protein BGZ89_008607 [Linnemannia elongata]
MHRIEHQAGRSLTRITAFRTPVHNDRALSSTPVINNSSNVRQNVAWAVGAGVVFTGVTLALQSPTLGLTRDMMVHNDSPNNNSEKQKQSTGSSFAILLGLKKQPKIEQTDTVLDTDLTVTSWKQQEQDALVDSHMKIRFGPPQVSKKYFLAS